MSTPNPEETLEFLSETVRERLLERIEEVTTEKIKVSGGYARSTFKKGHKAIYKNIGDLERELKRLKRGLGGLLTSNLDAKINPKTGETWKSLLQEIVHKNTTGADLAKRLNKFQKFVEQSANLIPGKVGHHRTGLSILREVLKDKPFDFRTKFKNIALKNGYDIGEEWIDWIDPAAHKEFTTHVRGKLNEKLGYNIQNKDRKDIPENLMNAIAERYAHAKQFGSNAGFDVPTGLLRDGVDEETLFKFSQPYLEASKRGATAGQAMDEILEKGNWNTADELIQEIDAKIPLNQTDDLFDIYSNQLGGKKKNTQVDLNRIQELGLNKADFQPHLFKNSVASKVLKNASKVATGAGAAEGFVMLASGQVVPGAMVLAMQTPQAQKQVGKALAKPVSKLLAKQGLKMIPGVSLGSGLLQSIGYLGSRQYGKAALSIGGGVIGEFGPAGDAVQAMIDLGLTVSDVKAAKAQKPDLVENEKGFLHTPIDEASDPAFAKTVRDLGENVNQFDSSGLRPRINIEDFTKQLSKVNL